VPPLINGAVPIFEGGDDARPSFLNSGVALAPPPTAADAADWHRQNAAETLAAIKDPQTWRDAANQYRMAMLLGTTAPGEGGILAYHGSPYSFDRFSSAHIGKGEGNASYGRGLYFAQNEATAKSYRDVLSDAANKVKINQARNAESALTDEMLAEARRRGIPVKTDSGWGDIAPEFPPEFAAEYADRMQAARDAVANAEGTAPAGHMYEVNIAANPQHMLDWDDHIANQPDVLDKLYAAKPADLGLVPQVARSTGKTEWLTNNGDPDTARVFARTDGPVDSLGQLLPAGSGRAIYRHFSDALGGPAAASEALRNLGVPGIRYLDQGSRNSAGETTSNYVTFDDALINVLRKYGIAGLLGGGGAAAGAAAGGGQDQQQ
jgi:hypothetical protein